MAYERNPDDLKISTPLSDEYGHQARLDNELQPDPELAEGPAAGGRIAMFAVAIAIILGAVFYGLNNSSVNQAGTSPADSTAQNTIPPAAPPGMRNVTPGVNTAPGVTTGAAPAATPPIATPQTPPSSAPTGTDLNRSGNPPVDNSAPADSTAPAK